MKKLRIAIFVTNFHPTPPRNEKVIYAPLWLSYNLVKGLDAKGHEVFLFGSSDSEIKKNLISNGLPSLKKNPLWNNAFKKSGESWKAALREHYELYLISKLFQMAQENEFNIIQLHTKPIALHFAPLVKTPICFTLHDPFDYPFGTNAVKTIYETFNQQRMKNVYFVSVSEAQRKPMPHLNYIKTIHNGIDTESFAFENKKDDYLFFAGRIIPEKGVDIAIRVAQATDHRLKIAGQFFPSQKKYWEEKIKPHLSEKITYEGMVGKKKLIKLYQKAKTFLMPTLFHESFGLVMAEAMSCGTPAIGFNKGAIPEVIKDGFSGFVVDNEKEMIEAIGKINQINPSNCRQWIQENYSMKKMVEEYEKAYYEVLEKEQRH